MTNLDQQPESRTIHAIKWREVSLMPSVFQRKGRKGWYFWYYDHAAKKWRQKKGGDTKSGAQLIVAGFAGDQILVKAKIITGAQLRQKQWREAPMEVVVDLFLESLDCGIERQKMLTRQLNKIIEHCGFTCFNDVDAVLIESFLSGVLRQGLSRNLRNSYRQAFNQLCDWAYTRGMIPSNPMAVIPRLSERHDKRVHKRALTQDEFWRLVDVTKAAKPGGAYRSLFYWCAGRTGLRWSEMCRIQPQHLDGQTLYVPAEIQKMDRSDTLSLDSDLAEALNERACHIEPDAPLFKSMPVKPTWRKDLARAKVPHTPRSSLRITFCTHLFEMGVDLRQAQKMMRHSDPRLTANIYTQIGMDRQADAIELLKRPNATSERKIG